MPVYLTFISLVEKKHNFIEHRLIWILLTPRVRTPPPTHTHTAKFKLIKLNSHSKINNPPPLFPMQTKLFLDPPPPGPPHPHSIGNTFWIRECTCLLNAQTLPLKSEQLSNSTAWNWNMLECGSLIHNFKDKTLKT